MQYVYANSICTIAASASSGPEGGLFRSRQPEVVCPAVVNVAYGDEAPMDCYIWDTKYWPRHFERSELLTRGWVFQERFLSPRVLYFGHDQILWECMTDHKCEGFPGGVPDHESDKSSYAIPSLEDSEVNRQGPLFSNTMFRLWTGLVWNYSECTLTKPTDKLAAFAGIAKLFQEHTGDEYVAGLWKSRLVEMLNWVVTTPRPGPVEYLAPSWSWASVQSSVAMRVGSTFSAVVNLVSVLAVETINREADPTVGVRYGCIKLHGALFPAQWDHPPAFIRICTAPHVAEVYLDTSSGKWDGRHPLFILPISMAPLGSQIGHCLIDYLILEKHSTGAPDIYQRIGTCQTEQHVKGSDRIFKDEGVDKAIFGVKPQFAEISIV
ncbi:hypothetical protein FALCPG4_002400 [Fusarium falciforme]